MIKQIIKKSKKGFSLPAAIGITAVLIILSASLIMIASNSISNTSSSVNSRQAYLNVKSALQYAEAYYSKNMSSLSSSGASVTQYMSMKDIAGGTTNDGAEVSSDVTTTNGKTTYVVATYTPATGLAGAKLKLKAYANYTDVFGKKGSTAQLSVTFDAGAKSGGRRITDPTIPPSAGVSNYSNNITLNVKKRPDQTWGSIAYYTWTFKDQADEYNNKSKPGSDGSYEYTPSLSGANTNEQDSNVVHPTGRWVDSGSSDKLGPPSLVSESGGGMLSSTFYPKNENVNYFNIIFANKGAVLEHGDNTQTCEMFHLWYLDPADKNIYFEFLKSEPWYYKGSGWNGQDNLEDTMLVYVKNTKTTVHFKIKGVDDTALTPTVTAPVINGVTVGGASLSGKSYLGNASKAVSNLAMTYEGCGWWTANVETSDSFKMTITYSALGVNRTDTVTVTPNSDNEAWVYANTTSGTIQSRLSESNANVALGVSSDSYVTIHAQSYDHKNKVTPILNYKDVQLNSSTGRINLYNKILEAQQYSADDYTDESYNDMLTTLVEAINMYNDADFIKNQSGSTTADKVKHADQKYNDKAEELDDKINALVGKDCDPETLKKLADLVKQGDDIVAEQAESGKYDSAAFGVFTASEGAYKKAKAMLNDSNLTRADASNQITLLQKAIDDIKATVIDKTLLETLINDATTLSTDTRYEQSYREILKTQITEATAVFNDTSTTQADVDKAVEDLQSKMDDVEAHPITELDTTQLTSTLSSAKWFLDSEPRLNCTDETYAALQAVYDEAKPKLTSAKTQEEIDTTTAKVKDAISIFTVVKPDASNDQLNHEKTIRVWVDGTAGYTSYTLDLVQKTEGDAGVSVYRVPNTSLTEDVASGLSYYDVNKDTYSSVGLTITDKNKEYESNKLSFDTAADNNMVVKLDSISNAGKNKTSTVSMQKLTTLYIEKKTLSDQPLVKVNNKEVNISSTDSFYYVAKFVYADNQKVVINSKSDGSGTNTDEFKTSAGQLVVRYTTDTTVELINVKNIYPKYEETTASSTGYKISNATIDAENLISPTILENVTGGYSIELTKSNTQKVEEKEMEVPVPNGKTLIVINTTNVGKLNGQIPYGYFWDDNGSLGAAWPGSPLLKYEDTNYYYAIVDNSVVGLIISAGGSGTDDKKVGGKIMFTSAHVRDHSTNTVKPYITIEPNPSGNSFSGVNAPASRPIIKAVVTMIDAGDMTGNDLKMAFVGGNKVRAINKSYVETYGENVKENQNHSLKLNNGNLFGGSGGNQGSMNRVGDSTLSPYYDWYEFKIPVDQLANYTFEIKGLKSASDTTYTEQISNVHGDVWLSLNGTHTDSGRYDDISVYTFDPEKNQMEYVYDTTTQKTVEKTRIYFNMPSGWSNAKVTASGVGIEETHLFTNRMTSYSANPSAVNYYFVDVDIDKPFLTFSVTDDSSKTVLYKTSLQGGDTVLFDPNLNGGNGGWNDYISPQTLLKREFLKAQTIYYGSVIIGKYDDDGYVADNGSNTYNYAGRLYEQYKQFTRFDASDRPDSTISLQKIYDRNNEDAYVRYADLHSWVVAYQNLYNAMSSAKMYIAKPITGGVHPGTSTGVYPEYKNRTSTQEYDDTSIAALKTKLQSSENTYLSSSADITAINKSTKALKAAISNVKVKSEGSITVIFYDAQEAVKNGAKVQIRYTKSDGSTVTEAVTSRNPENFPIIKISDTSIKDVDFIVNNTARGVKKNLMAENSTWVFMDQSDNPYWSENTTCDYVLFTTDSFEQSSSTETYTVTMTHEKDPLTGLDKPTYRDTVLYFNYDTDVTRAGGDSYRIKAGAYVFTNDDTGVSNSPFYNGTFDLYSDNSKDYFTNPENYGEIPGASDASTLGWVNSSGVLSGVIKSTANSVNVTVKKSTINTFRKYTSLQSMYFRYEDNDNNFVINNRVTLTAKEFVIASSAPFDGTHTINAHFYLNNVDASSNKVKVTFKSDINVKYRDNTGDDHSFIIREGTYQLSKQTASQQYIADFFDESYWKSPFVECLDKGSGAVYGNSNSTLSNPVYSND
ncbi:MAG: hypothetical protein ACI4GV_07790 [Acutalibacteraceae bacterium]